MVEDFEGGGGGKGAPSIQLQWGPGRSPGRQRIFGILMMFLGLSRQQKRRGRHRNAAPPNSAALGGRLVRLIVSPVTSLVLCSLEATAKG